ncbi:MAG: dGTPase, partial [Candidatus Paceibacteria bacterium]
QNPDDGLPKPTRIRPRRPKAVVEGYKPSMHPHTFLFDCRSKQAAEQTGLAPFAAKSSMTLGRKYPESADPLRTPWERDRDRIVHCTAFRRLMYKTQVFINRQADHQRTRLSHSLEVAQVARAVGTALGLNESLLEAVALAHDIGHPPFGHRGEDALDDLMKDHGGFRHNAQVLRVVDHLERRHPDYAGLNLTREVRESLLKHESDRDWPDEFRPKTSQPLLEAQVVDLADSTAYNMHDIQDGLANGIFGEEAIAEQSGLWRRAVQEVAERHPGFLESSDDRNLRSVRITNQIFGICVQDLIENSIQKLADTGVESSAAAREQASMLIRHSKDMHGSIGELQRFLWERVYHNELLREFSRYARDVLGALFDCYVAEPTGMAPSYVERIEKHGLERTVCDWLAGMTDRFAEQEYERLRGHPAQGAYPVG